MRHSTGLCCAQVVLCGHSTAGGLASSAGSASLLVTPLPTGHNCPAIFFNGSSFQACRPGLEFQLITSPSRDRPQVAESPTCTTLPNKPLPPLPAAALTLLTQLCQHQQRLNTGCGSSSEKQRIPGLKYLSYLRDVDLPVSEIPSSQCPLPSNIRPPHPAGYS